MSFMEVSELEWASRLMGTQIASLAALKSEHTPSGWGGHSRNTVVRNSP